MNPRNGGAARRFVAAALAAGALGGCVSLDQLPPGAVAGLESAAGGGAGSFPDLDAGATSIKTLHFTVKGYTDFEIRPISSVAESLYNKIGSDTGLYTFLASENFTIVVYKDQDEYLQKTRQPTWSRAVSADKTLYLYPDKDGEPYWAHEMVHLIFRAYLGDKAANYRWIQEGLAMHEELAKMPESDRSAYLNSRNAQLRQSRVPFSQMAFFVPHSEERRRVEAWYQQVESVVSYLLLQGTLPFAQLLNELRSGTDIDQAMARSYPGKFMSVMDLENAWKYSV